MLYLLDTNVISELVRPAPDAKVVAWTRAQGALDLAISVLTLGELEKGIALLRPGARRTALARWARSDVPRQFSGRLLPVTDAIALAWGQLAAAGEGMGRELPAIDGLLLATAQEHRLTFVTRNVAECAGRGVPVYDPWADKLHP